MSVKIFKPDPKYLTKSRVLITIIAVLVLLCGALMGWLISLDESAEDALRITLLITLGLDLLWWLPGMLLTGPYYRRLSYEIHDDEVIVHMGVIVQAVKHVPYRTVTNITVKRGILDRWLGIGSLDIQTAGMSNSSAAEESLVGLPNVQEIYDMVAGQLRRFRGAMAPTNAGVEPAGELDQSATLNAILTEVQAIRESLNR